MALSTEDPGDTPNNGLYQKAPPERGTFFLCQVSMKGEWFHKLTYMKGREICLSVGKKAQKG